MRGRGDNDGIAEDSWGRAGSGFRRASDRGLFSSRKGFLILSAGVAVPGSSKRARRLGQSAGASSRNPISVP